MRSPRLSVARTWGIAFVSGALAGLGYAAIGLAGRLALLWARATTVDGMV